MQGKNAQPGSLDLFNLSSPYLYALLAIVASVGGAVITIVSPEPLLPILLFVAAVIAILIVLNPELGLLILVFTTYTRFSDVLVNEHGLPSIAKPLVAFLVLVILVRWQIYQERPRNWAVPLGLLVAYALSGFVSIFETQDFGASVAALVDYAKDAIIVLIVVVFLTKVQTLRRVVWALLAAGGMMGTFSVLQYLTGDFNNTYWGFAQSSVQHLVGLESDYRIGGPFGSPNAFVQVLIPLVVLALDRVWNERRVALRVIAGYIFTVTLLTIIFTFSRNGFISLVLVMGLMFIKHPPRPGVIIALMIAGVIVLQVLPENYTARIASLASFIPGLGDQTEVQSEVSFRGRLSENLAGIRMFLDHPIIGVGASNFENNYLNYSRDIGLDQRRVGRGAHNLYLEIAAERGLVGLTLFFAIIFIIWKGLRDAEEDFFEADHPDLAHMAAALRIGLLGYFFAGIFIHLAYPRFLWILFGIAMAMPFVAMNVRKSKILQRRHDKHLQRTYTEPNQLDVEIL